MATQIKDFLTIFDNKEQIVPATNNKGTVTVTMPASATAGNIYPLEAFARDLSSRTVAKAVKNIMAVEPALEQPSVITPRHDSFVLNKKFHVITSDFTPTPGYPGNHQSTTYQVTTEPDGAGEVLCEKTSTTDLLETDLTLTRPLGAEETAYIRVKFTDKDLGDSEWSASNHIVGTYVLPPTVIDPKKEGVVYYKDIKVICEEMKCAGGVVDVHKATDWEIEDIHGTIRYASDFNDTVDLDSHIFKNAIPPDRYLLIYVTHHAEQAGASRTTRHVFKTSEKESIVAPSVVFPHDYCHPKTFTAVLSPLKMKNMEEYELEATRLVISSDAEGKNVLFDSGLKTSTNITVTFTTTLTVGQTIYMKAYEKEKNSGLEAWGEPQEIKVCRPLAPIILRPGPMEYFTDFPVTTEPLRTQGMTSDKQVSADFEIWTDDLKVKLDSAYDITDSAAMNEWYPNLDDSLMGSYIRVKARQTGEYTGQTAWTEKRILVHLPMEVFAPDIEVPGPSDWIHPTTFNVVLGPFTTKNVDKPNHAASQIKITLDAAGKNAIFFSSEFTNGDKRHYAVKLANPTMREEIYISARMKDAFAGWSDWGTPQAMRVTYPKPPVVNKPTVNALLGIENIATSFSGYAMMGNVEKVAFTGVHLVFKNTDTNEIYLDTVINTYNLEIALPEKARNKNIKLLASYTGAGVFEGEPTEVLFKTRLVSPGYRIDGKATVIGKPNGDPFQIAGRNVFIAVADAKFRGESTWGIDGINTTIPNNTVAGNPQTIVLDSGVLATATPADMSDNTKINDIIGGTKQPSEFNTRSMIVDYAKNSPTAGKFCYDTVIGNLHFSLGSLAAMGAVFTRGKYIDDRDPTVSQFANNKFYDSANDEICAEVLTSSEVSAAQCWGLQGYHPIGTNRALEIAKLAPMMAVPILELLVVDDPQASSTPDFTMTNIDRVINNVNTRFKIYATSKNPLNPVVKFKLDYEGKTAEISAVFGEGIAVIAPKDEERLTVRVKAVFLDGTISDEHAFQFPVYTPVIVPTNDTLTIQQGKSLAVTQAQLIANDVHDNPITALTIQQMTGCKVDHSGTNFVVTPTARYGEDCNFTYKLTDSMGGVSKGVGIVKVNITMLDDALGCVYSSKEIQEMIADGYSPLSPTEIFNNWERFSNTGYAANKAQATGGMLNWQMAGNGFFECTVNDTNSIQGFASPQKLDKYDNTIVLSSRDNDDDSIYFVIAYARINNTNYALLARRSGGGNHVGPNTSIPYCITSMVNGTQTYIDGRSNYPLGGGWANKKTAVRVVRNGDIIDVYTSPVVGANGTPVLDPKSKITINLNDYPALAWAKEPRSYGYACYSQRYSTFLDPLAAMDNKTLYDADTGDVWRYINDKWVLSTDKAWDVLDYPRYVRNPLTMITYLVTPTGLVPVKN